MFQDISLLSAFTIIFGLYSHFIKERLFISESLVAMLFGIGFGPACLALIFPSNHQIESNDLWQSFMILGRFVMTFQTMAAGISLPK